MGNFLKQGAKNPMVWRAGVEAARKGHWDLIVIVIVVVVVCIGIGIALRNL